MTDPIKPTPATVHSSAPSTVVTPTPVQQEAQKLKEKLERRMKERDAVRKIVDEAAKAHLDSEKKFLKEDEDERLKKAEVK